ncbi:MAG: PQQ-dependent sugar dehydrogenase [Planctomycetaceae bacterium]|nr:PQQ-dependent sugar dehydrogenase [Planctomycetaceae bacterium]
MFSLRAIPLYCLLAAVPATLPSCITTQRIASGLQRPVFVTHAPYDANRLFIVEQAGRIRIIPVGGGAPLTFLDIVPLVDDAGSEQGLLGMAFHPDFNTNKCFYVNYTALPDGATKIVEYKVQAGNANAADPASARLLLRVPQPQDNHNGGWLGFGVDNNLYIALGDGGGGNDDDTGHTIGVGNAQDIDQNLLGKILRVNPLGTGDDFPSDPDKNYVIPVGNPFVGIPGDDEIWAYGLRNPWRCSFDKLTRDLWIGDVGQDTREEIDFQPVSSPGGENYGWRLREGLIANPTPGIGGAPPPGNVNPLYDYQHGTGQFQGRSVTGGYVYRGPIVELQGKYFFADYVNQKVWSLTKSGSTFVDLIDWSSKFQPDAGAINSVSSFGEDQQGNVYIVDLDGEIFKIVKTSPAAKAVQSVSRTVGGLMGGR